VEPRLAAAVRIGLGYLDGPSEERASAVVRERAANGLDRSLPEALRRVSVRMDVLETMISVGVFGDFGLGRREALRQAGLFLAPATFGGAAARCANPDRITGKQLALSLPIAQDMVALTVTSAWERMSADYEAMGCHRIFIPSTSCEIAFRIPGRPAATSCTWSRAP
jgi:DNA polymerase III alpha subunit